MKNNNNFLKQLHIGIFILFFFKLIEFLILLLFSMLFYFYKANLVNFIKFFINVDKIISSFYKYILNGLVG
jgi:hypothetical protein